MLHSAVSHSRLSVVLSVTLPTRVRRLMTSQFLIHEIIILELKKVIVQNSKRH